MKSVDLSTYDNSWYRPGSSLKRVCWYCINIIFFKSSLFPFYVFKVLLLRWFGAKVGKNVIIKPGVQIKYPWFLNIGDNVWIGEKVWIDNLTDVIIGNNVCLSQQCLLLTGNHNYTKITFDLIVKKIILEDGVWIGAKATVCGGSICRNHSVLSVSSVASGELIPGGIYKGNPAVWVKNRIIS